MLSVQAVEEKGVQPAQCPSRKKTCLLKILKQNGIFWSHVLSNR